MHDRRTHSEPGSSADAGRMKAALEAKELRLRTLHLWGEVTKNAARTLLGVAPMVLALVPRFRIGAIAWIIALPLALYVYAQARRTVVAYRELQDARRSLRRMGGGDTKVSEVP